MIYNTKEKNYFAMYISMYIIHYCLQSLVSIICLRELYCIHSFTTELAVTWDTADFYRAVSAQKKYHIFTTNSSIWVLLAQSVGSLAEKGRDLVSSLMADNTWKVFW